MPGYLPDTYVFLWYATSSRTLKDATYQILGDSANRVFVSVASIWEIAIKQRLGKLSHLDDEPEHIVEISGFYLLDINAGHATTRSPAAVAPRSF